MTFERKVEDLSYLDKEFIKSRYGIDIISISKKRLNKLNLFINPEGIIYGHGTYILIKYNGKIYIGSSSNISSRLRNSHKILNYKDFRFAIVYYTKDFFDDVSYFKLEKMLIRDLKPDLNKQKFTGPIVG